MGLIFEWDAKKAHANVKKHGICFEEACTAFADFLSITIPDYEHSRSENRYVLLGKSSRGNTLVVIHLEEIENKIRIISARKATPKEKNMYEERP